MHGEPTESHSPERIRREDVVFLGWQKTSSGDEFALYNVTAESHPLYGSTVTDTTLREHNLPIPQTTPGASEKSCIGQTKSDDKIAEGLKSDELLKMCL